MASFLALQFREGPPALLYSVHDEYAAATNARTPNSNFLRGAAWSPDGACLLTVSDDNCLRIYDTPSEAFQLAEQSQGATAAAGGSADPQQRQQQQPQPAGQRAPAQPPVAGDSLQPALRMQGGEALYDWHWFPGMNAGDPASCCLATTGRAQPLHLWDAVTGELRCSYRAYNELDEVEPAHTLAFSADGTALFAGFNRCLRRFQVARPGRDCSTVMAYKKGGEGLPGIVSCIAANPDRSGMLAAGSYSGGAALLDSRTRELLCLLEGGHVGGLTHLCFSACGNFLYTGARRDPSILCWDVRYSSGVVYSLPRASCGTNQRIYFDVEPCGRHLATGGEDGQVRVFDLREGSEAARFPAAADTVCAVSFHPVLPLLTTASGQRRYPLAPHDDSDSDSSSSGLESNSELAASSGNDSGGEGAARQSSLAADENVLRVWCFAAQPLQAADAAAEVADCDQHQAAAGEEADAAEPMAADA
ncbi:telomerase Cajal body 1 [Micractinium conductrix]|uniref:Telomerase Cajal body 1 n=1 Tax=Micractinium conductrix TaxID=554055 RepID=A0A2P6V5G2_9CHLO|nr:telomerase Cajal body 1 [Micractinium conductrix]|eukprot:PSC69324.1 telomerase Cajal body 1 [Micractinium conductrix]